MVQFTSIISTALVAAASVHGAPTGPGYGQQMQQANSQQSCGQQMQQAGNNGPAAQVAQVGNAPKAVYFMTNAKPNMIAALKVDANGQLSDGSMTLTGGDGSVQVDPMTGQPTVPDALSSQGSVRVAGNMLFNVNAGSNTASMFMIDQNDPTKLTMVGQPANTAGEFPVTMAVSMKNKMVCVGNTGAKDGVACAPFDAQNGIGKMDALRPFNLGQKTPPTGPTNNVADSFFNEAENMLFTTVKGDPTSGKTGQLAAFAMQNGQVSQQNTGNSPQGSMVLFGTNQIPGTNNLLATDAGFGAAIISTDAQGKGTIQAKQNVTDQKATCWVTISQKTGTAFLTDVGKNHLLEMDTTAPGAIKEMNLTTNNPGMIDIESGGNFLYALSPGNSSAGIGSAVAVFDVSGGKGTAKQVQNFNPQGVSDTAQGMQIIM
jgi:hypothetical protein